MTFRFSKDLLVDQDLRKELAKPFGKTMSIGQLVKYVKRDERIYAIGDATLADLLKQKYTPKVGIFDYRVERSRVYFPIIKRTYRKPLLVKNSRGSLSRALWNAVKKSSTSTSPVGIRVEGEEDLASLACIHFAKKDEFVVYGIRGKGMAVIKINKRIRCCESIQ